MSSTQGLSIRINNLEKRAGINRAVLVEGMVISKTSLAKIMRDIDGATAGLPSGDA